MIPKRVNSQRCMGEQPASQQLRLKKSRIRNRKKPEETILYAGISLLCLSAPQRVLTWTVSPAPTGTSTHEIAVSFSISLCAFIGFPFTRSWPNVPGNAARQISAGPF